MNKFEELFEKLAKYNDRSVIWNNWLEYVININLIYKPESVENYHNNEKIYYDMMCAWLTELESKLETNNYFDILGSFYEELVQSRSKSKSLGQMYTPADVTNLLSELVNVKKGVAYDPTCGSGRTLLSSHVKSHGDVFCIGQDLDETSCKMSVLNFFSHGVRGSILHMDTLTSEFYKGWRVNKYLYHGIPLPHIEKITNINDAFDFIDSDVSLISNDNKKSLTVNDNVSKQTTLI